MAAFSNINDLSALTSMMAQAEEAAEARGGMSGNGIAGSGGSGSGGSRGKAGLNIVTPGTIVPHKKNQKNGRGGGGDAATAAGGSAAADPDDIWDAEEVDAHDPDFDDDGRVVPEYDIHYKQRVGSEDVFLGMSGKTPLTSDCKFMVLRIKLPGAKLKDIDLSVDKQKIVVQDPTYRLATYLPYPSDDAQGKAQWLAEKETLSVTLPILRSGW
jgi:hypothetical protein